MNREALVYVCLGVTYLLNWLALTLGLLPRQSTWLLEVAVAVLLVRSALIAYRKGSFRVPLPIGLVVLAVMLSALIGLVSGVPLLVTILGLRNYLRFPLIALSIVIAPLRLGFDRRFWYAMLGIGALQIVTSTYQMLTTGPGDLASGTFGQGGTGIAAIFLTAVAVTSMLEGLVMGRGLSIWGFTRGVLLLVPAVIGSVVAVFITVPACFLFGLLVFGRRPTKVLAGIAAATLILVLVTPFALDYMTSIGYVNPSTLLTSPSEILEYDRHSTSTGITMGRIDQVILASALTLRSDPTATVLGRGPASASRSSLGTRYGGPLLTTPASSSLRQDSQLACWSSVCWVCSCSWACSCTRSGFVSGVLGAPRASHPSHGRFHRSAGVRAADRRRLLESVVPPGDVSGLLDLFRIDAIPPAVESNCAG